jgi:hypothetical protein
MRRIPQDRSLAHTADKAMQSGRTRMGIRLRFSRCCINATALGRNGHRKKQEQ